jgi:hypothetical protein
LALPETPNVRELAWSLGRDVSRTAASRLNSCKNCFFAYPAQPQFLGDAIRDSFPNALTKHDLIVTPWSKQNVLGLKIDDLIREKLAAVDFLIADITYPNLNAYYEIGYAVGRATPFIPSLNYFVEKGK